MLALYRSNRLECLADDLARRIDRPSADADPVLTPEIVAVEHQGMARWLSCQLADRNRIHANVEFPLPAELIWKLLRCVSDDVPSYNAYTPDILTWRVLDYLYSGEAPDALQRYLEGLPDTPRFELARRIAECLDRYMLYRPEWIKDWQAGRDEGWQASLWQQLAGGDQQHWVVLIERVLRLLSAPDNDPPLPKLPPRINFFAVSAMSPGYAELLKQLARYIEVYLYILDPCQHYWGLIESQKRIDRRSAAGIADYREEGNGLLASMGNRLRAFNEIWRDADGAADEIDAGVEPAGTQVLCRLQRDMYHLRNGDEAGPVAATDISIQIHACHSRRREVEVLQDRLLGLFAAMPDLAPTDILVMAPDIQRYDPYIRAVFGSVVPSHRIPYSFTAAATGDDAVARAWLRLLNQEAAGYTAESVLSLLRVPGIHRAFGLEEAAVDMLSEKLSDAGLCGRLDGDDDPELPPCGSWQYVLDRLLLGFIAGAPPGSFDGVFHSAVLDGDSALSLGRLRRFIDGLRQWRRRSRRPLTPAEWSAQLHWSVNYFLDHADSAADIARRLHEAADALRERAAVAHSSRPVPLSEMLSFLTRELAGTGGHARMGIGVHFCRLTHMYAVPYRVVCLLGLSFDDYPGRHYPADFDRIAANPRPGDRSPRDEARALFLGALLSARDCLYISYIGRDIYDNSEQPPSVLVSELRDYLCRHYPRPDHWLSVHRLQPFSDRYFHNGDPAADEWRSDDLYSYDHEQMAVAQQLAGPGEPDPVFWPAGYTMSTEAPDEELTLEELCRFFSNPPRYFLRHILGIGIPRDASALRTGEPFALPDFADSRLRESIYAAPDAAIAPVAERARADAILPYGNVGVQLFNKQVGDVYALRAQLEERGWWPLPSAETLMVDLPADQVGMRLTGRLNHIEGNHVQVCPGGLYDHDKLTLWIEHLALCASWSAERPAGDEVPCSEIFGIGQSDRHPRLPEQDALKRLRALIDVYRLGVTRPLPLSPRWLMACAGKEGEEYITQWRKIWHERRGDGKSLAQRHEYALLFRGWTRDQLSDDEEFMLAVTRLSEAMKPPDRSAQRS